MATIDPSTVASWGSAEDRPERDRMRALLIGHAFLAAFREAEGGTKQHSSSWWFDWMRKNTALELRWMWESSRAFRDEHADVYAQVAGDLIIEETAKGKVFSRRWFRTDVSTTLGWLFEPACLEHDGWRLTNLPSQDGQKVQSWTRTAGLK